MPEEWSGGAKGEDLPPLRPSDADRDESAAAAREQFVAGRLSLADFEARLDGIFEATTLDELLERTRDLPATPPVAASRPRLGVGAALVGVAVAAAVTALVMGWSSNDPRGSGPSTSSVTASGDGLGAQLAAEQAARNEYEEGEAERAEWFTPCPTATDMLDAVRSARPTDATSSDGRLSDAIQLRPPPPPYAASSTGPIAESTLGVTPLHAVLRTNGWARGHATGYAHPDDGFGGFSASIFEFADTAAALAADQDLFNAAVCVLAADPVSEPGPPGALGARYTDSDVISWVEGNRWLVVTLYGDARGGGGDIVDAIWHADG